MQSNLDSFAEAHRDTFDVRTFLSPQEVIEALKKERPDAMLCDVFFYDSPAKANEIETRITKEAERLRKTGAEIGATQEGTLAGIVLMENIAKKFDGAVPFPIYAYTSKGPYLLQQTAWDRIFKCGCKVLLKNRYGRQIEKMILHDDIETHRERNSVRAKMAKHLYTVLITWGGLSTLLGVVLDRLFK